MLTMSPPSGPTTVADHVAALTGTITLAQSPSTTRSRHTARTAAATVRPPRAAGRAPHWT